MSDKEIIIDDLYIEVFSDEVATVPNVANRYVEELTDRILPLVAEQLEEALPENIPSTVERLEINIEQDARPNWQREVSGKITKALKKALSEPAHIGQQPLEVADPQLVTTQLERFLFGHEPFTDWGETVDSAAASMAQVLDKYAQLPVKRFLALPNQVLEKLLGTLVEDALYQVVAEIRGDELKQYAVEAVLNSYSAGVAVTLINWQKSFVKLLQSTTEPEKVLEQMKQASGLEPIHAPFAEISRSYQDSVSATALRFQQISTAQHLSAELKQFLSQLYAAKTVSHHAKQWLVNTMSESGTRTTLTFDVWLDQTVQSAIDPKVLKECANWRLASASESSQQLQHLERFKKAIAGRRKQNTNRSRMNSHGASIEVPFGGIVLLHPFLPRLFRSCGFLNEQNQWISERQQWEAVRLLRYIATGETTWSEDDYTYAGHLVEKLLVGLDLEAPMPAAPMPATPMPATPEPAADSDSSFDPAFVYAEAPLAAMLETIQEYWPPMRNNSWTSLRKDFLSRRALITGLHDGQLTIQVQPHMMDVLIPRIKWGLSIVRYSWMNRMMKVEWGNK